ncbi:hypothetical protein IJC60_03385 [bacterium]|nr:hypothetical protein [bacterium]
MKSESFINNDFFRSREFDELLESAYSKQISDAKLKIDEFYVSQNPTRNIKTEEYKNFKQA